MYTGKKGKNSGAVMSGTGATREGKKKKKPTELIKRPETAARRHEKGNVFWGRKTNQITEV